MTDIIRPWTCRDCKFYDWDTEKRYGSAHERMAYCPIAFNVCAESDGLVPGSEQQCEDFVWVDRGNYRHGRGGAKKEYEKANSHKTERIRIKSLIMSNPNMLLKDLEELTGLDNGLISRIRRGLSWKGIPWEVVE
jgi:hypothetical protein